VGGAEAIARGLVLSVYPLAQYRAWGDAATVSTIYFAVGVVSLATVLSVPLLTRWLPRRWTHLLAMALYLVSAAFGMVGGRFTSLAMLCASMATAISFVCYNANILVYIDKSQIGRLESLRLFYAGLGWVGGPFFGAWLYSHWHGAPFLVVAGAALATAALIWRTGMGSLERSHPIGTVSSNPLNYLPRFAAQPRLVAGWLLAVLRACGWVVFHVYIGIFAIESGLDARLGGLAASLSALGLFVSPLMMRWVHRRGLRRAVRIGFASAAACFMLAAACAPLPWISLGLLLVGAYFLILLDLCAGLPFLMSVKPSERSQMSAVYATFRDVANIVTPGIVWGVLQWAPLPAAFAVGGLGLLAAWWVAGHLHPQLGVPGAQRVRHRPLSPNAHARPPGA
jgi:predicted MFS family arabinose efflux permease